MNRIAFCLGLLITSGAALAAGQVDVSFKPLDQLSDAGRGSPEGERNLQLLSTHFKALAARLPDGQRLEVQVLDLDLAGEPRPLRRGGELRVMKGGADWPTMHLSWTLSANGRVLRRADEHISDMAYLMSPLRGSQDGPLGYEQRMLERWFNDRFGPAAAAAP